MNKRPLSVLIIGCLFIAAGIVGLAYHGSELNPTALPDVEVLWVLLVRIIAVVGGAFALRGANWARWTLAVWMGYHAVLSAFHSIGELTMHAVIFGIVVFFLFRPESTRFFRTRQGPTESGSQE